MSTKYMLANAQKNKNNQIVTTPQHEGIFYLPTPSLRQYFDQGNFTPILVRPGNKCSLDTQFNSKDFELDRQWLIRFDMETSDSTNHLTLYNDAYSLIDLVELEINGGSEKLIYDKVYQIALQRSDTLKEYAEHLTEKRAESDYEYATIAGVQVTDTLSKSFNFNLFDLFPSLRGHVMKGYINNLKINIRFVSAPDNAKDACLIGKSNTTSNAYTKSTISFNNIKLVRVFDIIRDNTVYSRPAPSARILQPYYEEHVIESQNMNTVGNQLKFKVQDHFKRKKTQGLYVWFSVNASAYNASTAQKNYSGFNYIKWRLAETTGDRKEVSFLSSVDDSSARLRNFEIWQQRAKYGEDLPLEVYTDSTNLNKYILFCTFIPFNVIENTEQIYDTVTMLDTSNAHYEVTLECATAVGADVDVHVVAMSYEEYMFNNSGQLVKLP